MLQRNLLYTGVTRAKKLIILAGSRRALAQAVRTPGAGRRHTAIGRASHFPDCGSFRVSTGKDGITWQVNTGNSLLSSVKKRPVWSWKHQGRS
jgi:hypothetical protein